MARKAKSKTFTGAIAAGKATARYLPADPALWLAQCAQANMTVHKGPGGLVTQYDRLGPDAEQADFLCAWLMATPGGTDAVLVMLSKRQGGV